MIFSNFINGIPEDIIVFDRRDRKIYIKIKRSNIHIGADAFENYKLNFVRLSRNSKSKKISRKVDIFVLHVVMGKQKL